MDIDKETADKRFSSPCSEGAEAEPSDGHINMTSSPAITALECRVGLGRVSVATDAIDVLAEYSVGARLPLTDRIGYSIGVWQDDIVLSLSLARVESGASRVATGLMLATPGAAIRWAFEIVAPVGLVEIASLNKPQSEATRWLRTATLSRGGAIQFVDVHALIGDLDALARERLA
jgi:hypothetical protein